MTWAYPKPPKKLYKYLRFSSRTLDILKNSEIYFAPPATFNDPFDCRIRMNFSGDPALQKERLVEVYRRTGHGEAESVKKAERFLRSADTAKWERIGKSMREDFLAQSGVVCLTENGQNLLMFAHYADSHRGFCLEFDTEGESPFGKALPVRYASEYPEVSYMDRNTATEQFIDALLVKSPDWQYEREWRRVRVKGPAAGPRPFRPEVLTGVTFGCQMPQDQKVVVGELVRNRASPVRLFEARPHPSSFQLDLVPVD